MRQFVNEMLCDTSRNEKLDNQQRQRTFDVGGVGDGNARDAYAAATGAAVSVSTALAVAVRFVAAIAPLVNGIALPCDASKFSEARVELENGDLPCDAARVSVDDECCSLSSRCATIGEDVDSAGIGAGDHSEAGVADGADVDGSGRAGSCVCSL